MDGLHQYIIEQNREYLLENLDTDAIKEFLYQKKVINEDQLQQLEFDRETKRQKAEKLLPMLKENPMGYEVLLEALRKRELVEIEMAQRLQSTDTSVYKAQQRRHEENMKSASRFDRVLKASDMKVYNILCQRPEVFKDWKLLARGLKIKEASIVIIDDKFQRLNDKLYQALNENSTFRFLLHDVIDVLDKLGHRQAIDDLIKYAKKTYPHAVHS